MLEVGQASINLIDGVINHHSIGDLEYRGIVSSLRNLRSDYDDPANSWIKGMAPSVEVIDILSPELAHRDEVKEIVSHIGAPEFFGSQFKDIESLITSIRKVEDVYESVGTGSTPDAGGFGGREEDSVRPPIARTPEMPPVSGIPDDEEVGDSGEDREGAPSSMPEPFDDPKLIYDFWKDKLLTIEYDEGIALDVSNEEFASAEDVNIFLVESLYQEIPVNALLDRSNQLSFEQILSVLNDISDTIARIEQGLEDSGFKSDFISDELPQYHASLVELIREVSTGESQGDGNLEGLSITDEKTEKEKEERDKASGPSGSVANGDFLSQIKKSLSEPELESSYKHRYKKAVMDARESGEEIPSKLLFHPIFESMAVTVGEQKSGRIFKEVRLPDTPEGELVGLDFDAAGTVNFDSLLSQVESKIKQLKKDAYSGIGGLGRQNMSEYNEARASSMSEADDLFSAIKSWDEENEAFQRLYEARGIDASDFAKYSFRNIITNESSSLFLESIELIQHLVFPYLFSENLYDIPRERRGDEEYKKLYVSTYISQIKRKFKNYFEPKMRHKYGRDFLCFGMSRDIGKAYINMIVQNTLDPYAYVGRRYIGCPMCNKKIYFNKYTKKLGDSKSFDDIGSYSDYDYQRYSLFRTRGRGLITEDLLNDPGSEDGRYYSPTYGDRKSWQDIQELISSDAKKEHHEGMIRRGEALKSLGAKKIGTTPTQVAQVRYKCPFSKEQMPMGWEKEDEEGLNISSQCGLSFDTSIFDKKPEDIRVENLQYSASEGDDSGNSFVASLDSAVKEGKIDEEKRDDFLRHFKKMKSGGWKFSRLFFACPCHVEVPESDLLGSIPPEYKKYKYLAVPHAGPLNAEKQTSLGYNAPTNPDGTVASFEEGRSAYLVCGATTSLSSFNRDPSHAQSIARLFRDISSLKSSDPQEVKARTAALINTLIRYGVDFEDILPFVKYLQNPEFAVEALEKTERITKIADILALAMAMDLRGGVEENRWIEGGRIELLNNIGLVCHHGHKFTIGQSTGFGASHAGFDLSSKTGTHTWHSIEKTGILTSRGENNFSRTLSSNIIQKIDSGDTEMYSGYDEWSGSSVKKKKIRDLLVRGHKEGEFFAFNSDRGHVRKYIWGYENSDREAYDPHIAPDRRTFQRTMIRAVESESNEMYNADGSIMGATHADKHAYDRWRESLSEASSDNLDQSQKITASIKFLNSTLKNYLQNVVSWLDVGTSMEVQDVLTNKQKICCEDSEIEAIKDAVYDISISLGEAGLVSGMGSSSSVPGDVINEFDNKILSRFKNKDINFLRNFSGYNKYSVSNLISTSFISLVMSAIEASGGSDVSVSGTKREFVDHISGSSELASIVNILVPDVVSHDNIFSDEGKSGEKKSIIALRRSEYTGRLIMVASAMYLADSVSRIYRMSMDKDLNSRGYLGFDLGVDLSTSEKIMNLSYSDIDSMASSLDDLESLQSGLPEEGRFNSNMSSNQYNAFRANIEGVFEDLIAEASRVRIAGMSHAYLARASEYITGRMLSRLDDSDDSSKESIVNILEKILGSIPVVEMSLHRDDKYARYTSDPSRNYHYVPTYRASIAMFRGDDIKHLNWAARTAMFIISSSKEVFDSHNLGIGLCPDSDRYYVLAKVSMDEDGIKSPPFGELVEAETQKLPDEVRANGWSVVSVPVSKYEAKKQTNVSVASHPYTYAHEGELRNDINGMRTSSGMHIGRVYPGGPKEKAFPPCRYLYDSPVGLMIPYDLSGKLSKPDKAGVTRNVTSPVGTTVPKKGTDDNPGTAMGVRPPVVEVKAPVNIGSANEEMIRDMSQFLQRHPDSSNKIFSQIDKKYAEYLSAKRDLLGIRGMSQDEQEYVFRSLGVSSPEAKNKILNDREYRASYEESLKRKYSMVIGELHKQYRNLPYHVESKMVRTYQNGATASGLGSGSEESPSYWPVTAPYIPMLDWATVNHMINSVQYGPEFGGHTMWSISDSADYKARVKACMVNFLTSVYNLDTLAGSINKKLSSMGEDVSIDVEDVLNVNSAIRKIGDKNMKKIFGYDTDWTESSGASSVFWSGAGSTSKVASRMKSASSTLDRFAGDWHSSIGKMYYIEGPERRMSVEEDGSTSMVDPGAFIRVWADVNPVDYKTMQPDNRFESAQSYDSDDRLKFEDIESTRVMHSPIPFRYNAGANNIYEYSTRLSSLLFDDINASKDEHIQYMEELSKGIDKDAFTNRDSNFNKFSQRRKLLNRIILKAKAESLLGLLK